MDEARFPSTRLRRNRRTHWSRRLVAEHALSASDFIWPIFIIEGDNRRVAVDTMPGVDRLTIDLAVGAAEQAARLGIPAVATVHPSSILRAPDDATREEAMAAFVADMRSAAKALNKDG